MARGYVVGEAWRRTIDEAAVVELFMLLGWPFELRAGRRVQAEREARAALERLIGLGLPHARSAAGGRLFDPTEAVNVLRWAGRSGLEPTLGEHNAPTARRLALEVPGGAGEAAPSSPARLGPQRYAVTITRSFNLEDRRPGERVRLRLPAPIEDAALSGLRIEPLPPGDVAVETIAAPARLDMVTAVPAGGEVTVGLRATFTARPSAPSGGEARLDPAEAALYTRPSEGMIRVSDRVRALAAALAGDETEPWALLRRFWSFMLDELAFGAVHYDRLGRDAPLDRVLDEGWCDCVVGSALMVALCRARGVPARLVTGYLLYEAAPGFHTWLEAWIEGTGWAPFDLACWDLSLGADPAWRDYYFGQLDHRMVVERPPRLFGGGGSVRLPAGWRLLGAVRGAGSDFDFRRLDDGALIYREHVEVRRLGPQDPVHEADQSAPSSP
jgi:transglutaminase-like putative cysteine protease